MGDHAEEPSAKRRRTEDDDPLSIMSRVCAETLSEWGFPPGQEIQLPMLDGISSEGISSEHLTDDNMHGGQSIGTEPIMQPTAQGMGNSMDSGSMQGLHSTSHSNGTASIKMTSTTHNIDQSSSNPGTMPSQPSGHMNQGQQNTIRGAKDLTIPIISRESFEAYLQESGAHVVNLRLAPEEGPRYGKQTPERVNYTNFASERLGPEEALLRTLSYAEYLSESSPCDQSHVIMIDPGPRKQTSTMNPDPVGAAQTSPETSGQQRGPTETGPADPVPANPERRTHEQEVRTLWHAHICLRAERERTNNKLCTEAYCRPLKEQIRSAISCPCDGNCTQRQEHEKLRENINHWNGICLFTNCSLCVPIRGF